MLERCSRVSLFARAAAVSLKRLTNFRVVNAMRRLPAKFTARSEENFHAELHLTEIRQVNSPTGRFFAAFPQARQITKQETLPEDNAKRIYSNFKELLQNITGNKFQGSFRQIDIYIILFLLYISLLIQYIYLFSTFPFLVLT